MSPTTNSQCAPGPAGVDLGALPDEPLPQPARLARQVALARVGDRPGEGDDVAPKIQGDYMLIAVLIYYA